jgi:prohibitin 2
MFYLAARYRIHDRQVGLDAVYFQKGCEMKVLFLVAMLLTGCGCEVVDTGYRGVETKFGEIQGGPLPEGFYFYNPVTSSIKEIDVREHKLESVTEAFTRDTQNVKVAFAMTFYPDPKKIHEMYRQFGDEWQEKIVLPATLGSIKDVIGQYIADDLVSKRETAKKAAEEELKANLASRDVLVTRLDFTNLDFDDAYEKAVEAKVVAIQKAAEAKNKTVEVEEQAKQQIISAEAQAKSMRIRSEALSQNKNLVEYEAVQKWNGVLPQYSMGGAVPFLNLTNAGPK